MKQQGPLISDFLFYEMAPEYCREVVTLTGENLNKGTVLGKITASGKWASYDNTASNGLEVASGVLLEDVDASTVDRAALVLVRGPAIVKTNGLSWNPQNDSTAITAGLNDLKAIGILSKDAA